MTKLSEQTASDLIRLCAYGWNTQTPSEIYAAADRVISLMLDPGTPRWVAYQNLDSAHRDYALRHIRPTEGRTDAELRRAIFQAEDALRAVE